MSKYRIVQIPYTAEEYSIQEWVERRGLFRRDRSRWKTLGHYTKGAWFPSTYFSLKSAEEMVEYLCRCDANPVLRVVKEVTCQGGGAFRY